MAEVAVGDWVQTALWPGIWQVYRVESDFFEDRCDLSEPKVRSTRTLVFIRRIVGRSGKKSFDTQVCDGSLVAPLPTDELQRFQERLRDDPKLAADFDAYRSEPVDLVANIGLGLPEDFGFDRFTKICERMLEPALRDAGLTVDDVLALLADSELEQYRDRMPTTATLQLVSPDHLRRGDDFVVTNFRTLNF